MAPDLLNPHLGTRGYLGAAVDVWASGILLIAMLVRACIMHTKCVYVSGQTHNEVISTSNATKST